MKVFQYKQNNVEVGNDVYSPIVLAEIQEDSILTADKIFIEEFGYPPTIFGIGTSIIPNFTFTPK